MQTILLLSPALPEPFGGCDVKTFWETMTRESNGVERLNGNVLFAWLSCACGLLVCRKPRRKRCFFSAALLHLWRFVFES